MTIKLPPLPEPMQDYPDHGEDTFTADQLRTAQREAALMALEEAAKLCDLRAVGTLTPDIQITADQLASMIRALRAELENTK